MTRGTLVENRLANLERDVAELKHRIVEQSAANTWLYALTGSMSDIPDFNQVLELGRQARVADSPEEGSR